MEIRNHAFLNDMESQNAIYLNLGSGTLKRPGFYSLDIKKLDGVDIVADLEEPLSLIKDDTIDYIYSNHVFEHIHNFLPLMQEIYRITKPDGIIDIVVPHFSNHYGYSDPTHKRFFGLYSFYYFVSIENQPSVRQTPNFYSDIRFIIKKITIEYFNKRFFDKILNPVASKLFNRNIYWQDLYESYFSTLIHARQIRYILQPKK